jgi:hypothetical protein
LASTNSAVVFSDVLSQGTTNYKIIGDINSSAVDLSTVQMDFNLVVNAPAGATITVDSLGQIMTIDNPVTVCTTNVTENPTPIYIYPGILNTIGSFAIDNSCPFKMDSIKVEIVGTGNPNKCTNLKIVRKNTSTQFGNTISTASFVNTFTNVSNLINNQYDTFSVVTNLVNTAIVGATYQPYITIYGHVVGSTMTQSFVLQNLGTKIVATPTGISGTGKEIISILPNPGSDYIQIAGMTEPTEITMMNSVGEIVFKKTVSSNEHIDISTLRTGLYFMSIKNTPGCFKINKN